jgi:hypothetical protein
MAGIKQLSDWEAKAQRGTAFHRLVHQHTVGIPEAALTATITDSQVRAWWLAYLRTPPSNLPSEVRRSEVRLSIPLGRYRLMARYDLLAIAPGRKAVIVDWKTGRSRPRRVWLKQRWQTRVYRYVLVEAGARLNEGSAWSPSQVELVYWFTNHPQPAQRFAYDANQHAEDSHALGIAVTEILALDHEVWPLVDDLRHCRYCTYRTLCQRGVVDAPEPEWEPGEGSEDWEIDLDHVGEIEF